MTGITQIKVGNQAVNLSRITHAEYYTGEGEGIVRIFTTGIEGYFSYGGEGSIEPCTIRLTGEEAEAFWRFYTSPLYGCLDVVVAGGKKTVEISGLREEI